MSSVFLSDAELFELTGYKQAAAQVRWLRRNGVRFYRQRETGSPRVPRDALLQGRVIEQEGPRLDWLKNGKREAA